MQEEAFLVSKDMEKSAGYNFQIFQLMRGYFICVILIVISLKKKNPRLIKSANHPAGLSLKLLNIPRCFEEG